MLKTHYRGRPILSHSVLREWSDGQTEWSDYSARPLPQQVLLSAREAERELLADGSSPVDRQAVAAGRLSRNWRAKELGAAGPELPELGGHLLGSRPELAATARSPGGSPPKSGSANGSAL